MLDLLRRKAQSPYIQATIVIIILVFIFWLPKMGGNNRPNVVATVNDHPIGLRDYQQRYDRMVSELRDQLGGVIPKGLLETMNIKEQVINQLIEETLLIMTANEIGLATSAAEVARTIHQMEPFKKNGTFTKVDILPENWMIMFKTCDMVNSLNLIMALIFMLRKPFMTMKGPFY